jgi:hypothetical protein
MVPMVMFIVASSNPSAWALTAVGGGWLALLGYLETRGARAGVLASLYLLCAVLAVSSRVDSVLYLGLASLLAVFLSQTRGVLLLKKMWIALVGVLFVVARLIANPANLERVIEGLGQRSGGNENPLPWTQSTEVLESGAFDWSLLWNNLWSVPGLWLGTFGGHPWGSLGWLDTKLPQIVLFCTLTVLAGVIFAALKSFDTKKSLSLAVAMGALWIMPLYLLQLGGFQVGEEIQPRYLLPLTVLAVGILVLGSAQRPFTLSVRQQWFAVVALSLANAVALHTNLRRYVTGTLVEGFNLESPQEWWWPFMPELISPTFVWAIGTLSFALVLWALLVKRMGPQIEASERVEDLERVVR